MVLYRKYRPQQLADLDSESLRTSLNTILSSSYSPHAFLFSGPKGTGKTSAARIVAKILNCEKRKNSGSDLEGAKGLTLNSNIEPCNVCESCLSITAGRHLDIIEIDAASNRGIDEIRELREKIKLAPVSAKFKVYIIDEVHMLTTEAFNALLKTLEEPPPHAVFILATTEPDKLLPTIISRCIRINFQKATVEEVKHSLKRVLGGEKLEVGEDVLSVIAQSSDGSFRDGTKLLEQALAEGKLTLEGITVLIGRDMTMVTAFMKLLSAKETKTILSEIENYVQKGVNIRFFVEDSVKLFHDLLLAGYNINEANVPEELKGLFQKDELIGLIKLFSRVYTELRNTSLPHLPLEVAAVEWCEGK